MILLVAIVSQLVYKTPQDEQIIWRIKHWANLNCNIQLLKLLDVYRNLLNN